MSMPALDALDRARTLALITVSPLEEHGPHLPLGVDAFTARHFAELIAGRLIAERPGWSVVLAPTLHLGSFTFEAAGIVSRRHGVTMASLSGHLAWGFRNGRFLDDVERALGRSLTEAERRAFAEDAHGGWWETSMMLMLRPELVDRRYRDLPPATYSLPAKLRRDYPLRGGGQGYVGHPALADVDFAKAT